MRTIAVIGGSGIYDLEGLSSVEERQIETPFGAPSDALIVGELHGARVIFLSRHGRGHRIPPHEINYRANIWALKKLGAEWLISVSAVGSMKEEIRPGDMVLPDQFIDRTNGRSSTFFESGIAAHVGFAEPVSNELASLLFAAATEVTADSEVRVHRGGTYLVMNGPQFSTKAESQLHRSWGISVIGMTNMPEAKLAREAEISYATLALATDYDCWREGEEAVSVEAVLAIMAGNVQRARAVVGHAVKRVPEVRSCPAASALEHAIMTKTEKIPANVKRDLEPLIGKYL